MPNRRAKLRCCPLCWATKHASSKCSAGASPTIRCSKCALHIIEGVNDIQSSIKFAESFPDEAVHKILDTTAQRGSLLSLDSQDFDSRALHFNITSSIGGKADIDFSIENYAQFSIENRPLIVTLDDKVRRCFTAQLDAREGDLTLIADATLAGGYAGMLFSAGQITEYVQTFRDGVAVDNEHHGHNLDAHCKILLAFRLGELVEEVMAAIRHEHVGSDSMHYVSNAFAAAVILQCELGHFKGSLRNGFLSRQGLPSLPAALLNWIGSVERELIERIREACGRFPDWGSAIKGSMKKLRRKGEILTVKIQMHQNTYSLNSEPWLEGTSQLQYGAYGDSLASSTDAPQYTPPQADATWPQYSDYEPAMSTMNGAMQTQSQVPVTNSASSIGLPGQMSCHPSLLADSNLFPGYDSQLTSLDPRSLMSTDWAANSGQI